MEKEIEPFTSFVKGSETIAFTVGYLDSGSNNWPQIVTRIIEPTTEKQRQEVLKAFHRRLQLNGIAIDRLLGLADGTLYVPDLREMKKVMSRLGQRRSFKKRDFRNQTGT